MTFEENKRLEPDEARRFIKDLVYHMERRVWNMNGGITTAEDGDSIQKQFYGDTWTFLYGISSGMNLMDWSHTKEFDSKNREVIDHGISGDAAWREHYEQYGYGPYGEGLEIGKRLAFYEDRDFTISEEVNESEHENKFVIRDYDDI